MKNTLLLLFAFFITITSWADVISFKDGKQTEGKVKRIKKNSIVFRSQGKRFVIPIEDIDHITFDKEHTRLVKKYASRVSTIPYTNQNNELTNDATFTDHLVWYPGVYFGFGATYGNGCYADWGYMSNYHCYSGFHDFGSACGDAAAWFLVDVAAHVFFEVLFCAIFE